MSRPLNLFAQKSVTEKEDFYDLMLAVAAQIGGREAIILRRAVEDLRDEHFRRPLPSHLERAILNPKRDEHGNVWIELQGEKLDLEPLAAKNVMMAWANVIGGAYVRQRQG